MGSTLYLSKFIHFGLLISCLILTCAFELSAQVLSPDTLRNTSASQPNDSLPPKKRSKSQLDSKVEYIARDSMQFDIDAQKIFLYGNAEVKYEGTTLKANYIELGMKDNILSAHGTDSAGHLTGKPFFDDNGQSFTAEAMRYNFKTQKGKIIKAITQEGDGYIHGESIKKSEEDILYIKDGKYTTCNQPEPHFHIEATRLKVIKDDKIVTGPAYLVVENAPTPLAVPFGMFPNKKERTSGIVIPQYGQSPSLGFFLLNGGYYLGYSEYFDLKILGDLYSRGSWAGRTISTYRKRYKYNGSFDLSYTEFITGDRDFENLPAAGFQQSKNFFIKWNHLQDPKANPTRNFSANVNAGSSSNFTNNLNATTVDYFTNVFKSSISYQKTFSILNIPSNINITGSHDQNTRDSVINVNLPQISFNMNRFFPFKSKIRVGELKPWETVSFGFRSLASNSVTFKEGIFSDHPDKYLDQNKKVRDTFLLAAPVDTLFEMMRNGISHDIPVTASWKVLKYMTLTPQLNYSEKWYFETRKLQWNPDSLSKGEVNKYVIDTVKVRKFDRFNEYNGLATLSTTVYGMYSFRSKALQAIRHMLVPSVGFSARPDFSEAKFSYYDSLVKPSVLNPSIDTTFVKYTRFDNGIVGKPSAGKSGLITFSLINNLEMKVGSKKDTVTGNKKIKIFETLSLSSNYNILADSMKLAPIDIAGRTNLFQALNLNFSGTLNPYKIYRFAQNEAGEYKPQRVDTLVWSLPNWWNNGRPIGVLTQAQLAVSLNLKGGNKSTEPKKSNSATDEELALINSCIDCYVDFTVPWTLNFSYNLIYQKPLFIYTLTNTFTFNGDVRLTPNWKIGFNSGYDFRKKEFILTSIDFYRDLHCWEMRLNVIPFGQRQSYMFTINVKSSVLQDLKLTRRKQWFDQ